MPLPEGTVLQLFADAAHLPALAGAAGRAAMSLRPNGPGQWYLVSDIRMSKAELAEFAVELPNGAAIVDQSHGRVRIGIEGAGVEEVLAKGTGIDLSRFDVGAASTALFGHIAAHLTRTSQERFEIMTLRGFAESLWHELQASAESTV
jgi:sarcosine oxidase subunit gamma